MEENRFNCTCQTIKSISEYISVIERNDLFNCISRGENKRFESPLKAGVFRNKGLQNYNSLLEQFHLEVETSINNSQEKHFLAFAQHHGMPTNLLDFSLSPLVSLYFSVDGCTDEGYVYFINRSKLVNINQQIINHALGWGLLSDFMDSDPSLMQGLLPALSDAFENNIEFLVDYFEKHVEAYISRHNEAGKQSFLNENGVESLEESLTRFKCDKEKWIKTFGTSPSLQVFGSYSYFLESIKEVYIDDSFFPHVLYDNLKVPIGREIVEAKYIPSIYLLIMLLQLEKAEQYHNIHLSSSFEIELDFPIYFSYRPPVIDDRVRNQFSIFVFQPFSNNNYYINSNPVQTRQIIRPDFVVKVNDPNKLKYELEALGYNRKHIYCDYDSVARYIRDSV